MELRASRLVWSMDAPFHKKRKVMWLVLRR
jgi:hypothetical protein